mmetsp:Transcript_12934/g.44143  ORF Transcript_12934/g.44143 Transcript_12934/m.44143 type:complete len:210 (-) Transcript_12934:129-758(-)
MDTRTSMEPGALQWSQDLAQAACASRNAASRLSPRRAASASVNAVAARARSSKSRGVVVALAPQAAQGASLIRPDARNARAASAARVPLHARSASSSASKTSATSRCAPLVERSPRPPSTAPSATRRPSMAASTSPASPADSAASSASTTRKWSWRRSFATPTRARGSRKAPRKVAQRWSTATMASREQLLRRSTSTRPSGTTKSSSSS